MLIMESHELKIYMDKEMREIARIYNIVRLMVIFTGYYYLVKHRLDKINTIITFSDSIADWIDVTVLIGTFLLELIVLFLVHRFVIRPCRLKFMKAVRVPNSYFAYNIVPAKKGECLTVCYKKDGYLMYKNFFCIRKKGKYRTRFGLYWFEFSNVYEKESAEIRTKKKDVVTVEKTTNEAMKSMGETISPIANLET